MTGPDIVPYRNFAPVRTTPTNVAARARPADAAIGAWAATLPPHQQPCDQAFHAAARRLRSWQPTCRHDPNKGVAITQDLVPDAPTYLVLETPHQRSGSPICSLPCLATWARATRQPVILGSLPTASTSCTHCVICAVAIHRPDSCLLHERCPPYLWAGTITARPIIAAIAQRNRGQPVTDVQINCAAEIAWLCPELLPGEVAQRVLRRAGEHGAPGPGRG